MARRGSVGAAWLGILILAGCGGSPPPRGAAPPPPPQVALQENRSVIESGAVEITVEDPTGVADRVRGLATAEGGRLESSDSDGDGRVSLVLRIPAGSLIPLVVELRGLGEVTKEELGTEDVTDERIDLTARLQSLTAMRDRLRSYLDQASELGDMITVERELARVQAEIDALQSRLQYLDSYVAMSELDVTLSKRRRLGPVSTFGSWIGKAVSKLFIL